MNFSCQLLRLSSCINRLTFPWLLYLLVIRKQSFLSKNQMIRKPFSLIVLLFLPVLSLLFSVHAFSDQPLDKNGLKREIMILSRTREKAVRDLKQNSNHADKRQFVSYLDKRIASLCETLASGFGFKEISGLHCPPVIVFVPSETAKTLPPPDESIKKADTDLLRSLGDFDDLLKREQERIENETMQARQGAGEKGSGYGKSSGGLKNSSGTEMGTDDGTRGSQERDSERDGRNRQEGKGPSGDRDSPQENPSGTKIQGATVPSAKAHGPGSLSGDDDIVARQLREAAEREKDPELKKRLWEEYRKYKEGQK